MLNTPVLFLVFNRLDTTKQVFAKIREIQPKQLFIGADGARAGKEGEAEKVQAVRQYVLNSIDWDCEVKTLFREENLGCGKGVSEAITWFFDNVEQGIILEDDCLPDLSFFTFCEELLDYYKDNEQIMHISGNNFQFGKSRTNNSYYFSKYTHNWGWATWKRAWKYMDFEMTTYQYFLNNLVKYKYLFYSKKEKKYWINEFSNANKHISHVWDLQWMYSVWKNKGVGIIPNVNLVTNIGVNLEATHTFESNHINSIVGVSLSFPIKHPEHIKQIKEADLYVFEKCYTYKTSFLTRITLKLKKILKHVYTKKNYKKNIF